MAMLNNQRVLVKKTISQNTVGFVVSWPFSQSQVQDTKKVLENTPGKIPHLPNDFPTWEGIEKNNVHGGSYVLYVLAEDPSPDFLGSP